MIEIKQLQPVYPCQLHQDFRELINYTASTYGDESAFILKHKKSKKDVTYEHISFIRFKNEINYLGTGLVKRDLEGKRIAIIGKNRYEWILSYFASLCGIGICIPLDKGLPFDEAESSLARSYADVLVFDKDHLELVEEIKKNNNTKITDFICMDEIDGYPNVNEITAEGKNHLEAGFDRYLTLPIDGKGTTIILFTSGTTSMSKAVMLSQYNITFNIYAMLQVEDIRHGDINMAFLPYHHTFGSTGQTLMLAVGATTTFCDGLKYIQKNIIEYKVSIFVCVPLLIESIYKKIMSTVKKEGKEKKLNFGLKLSNFLLKLGIDKRRVIFKDIMDQLGGNLRFIISGASAIDPVALIGFRSFGIDVAQGYGMTEASPVLAAESIHSQKAGSIGLAMLGVDLRIVDENEQGVGELIAKAPNVMSGYYENPEETAKILKDGWLYTGDLAYVDKDGFVFICGRKKNVIVLKNGKNIYPEEIELLISNLPYVEENMVFGQQRHKDGDHKDLALCAKVVYNKDWFRDNLGTIESSDIEKHIKKDMDAVNDQLPTYKHVLRLIITDEPMIKTTTGKVKRFEEIKQEN